MERMFLDILGLDWSSRLPLMMCPNKEPKIGPPRLAHLTASQYVDLKYVPESMFSRYYKFSFVRNPWARCVSFYKYMGFHYRCSFRSFVLKHLNGPLMRRKHWFIRPQYDFLYSETGDLLVDYIGRLENIQDEMDYVFDFLGLNRRTVPHLNESSKRRFNELILLLVKFFECKNGWPVNYRDYYDDESLDIVSTIYKKDINVFDYTF